MDITREFYVEPFNLWPFVVETLQGKVEPVGNTFKRTRPARDTIVRNAFCNETIVTFADSDAMASSPSLGVAGDETRKQIENVEESPESVGAKITAHYRPLITAWQPKATGDGEGDPFAAAELDDDVWDWMDPTFNTSFRQIPWTPGLNITFPDGLTKSVPQEVASPMAIPVTDFTIKRMFIGKPPWDLISRIAGCVNSVPFPVGASPAANGLPKFETHTLRFDAPTIKNMMDSRGRRWYEITYNFKWIQSVGNLFDALGKASQGHVTWNHVFMSPTILGFGGPTGWFQVWRGKFANIEFPGLGRHAVPQIPGFAIFDGLLYNEANFMPLFSQ